MSDFKALTTTARWILLRTFEQPHNATIRVLAAESRVRPMSVLQVADAAHELARRGLAVRRGEEVHLTALGVDLAAVYVH